MSIKRFFNRARLAGYITGEQEVPLTRGVNLHEIRIRLTATVDVAAGGGNDGVLQTEGIQRFIRTLRVTHDGVDVVRPVTVRDLYQLSARVALDATAATNLAAPGIATTNVALDFVVPFWRQYLSKPINVCWPGTIPINQQWALYYTFDDSLATAGDSPGSGAFIVGGDRAVTITNVALEIIEVYSTGRVQPWRVPRITVRETRPWTAGQADFPLDLQGLADFDSVLLRTLESATRDAFDGATRLRLQAGNGSVRFADASFIAFQRDEQVLFPAVRQIGRDGTLFHLIADGGLLSNRIEPGKLPTPEYMFDVITPPVGPDAIVRGVFMELIARPPYTLPQQGQG
jgi:hypothetical protein